MTTSSVTFSFKLECYYNWYLFLGGMNLTEAQVEGDGVSNIVNQGVNGYWYSSSSMKIEMCISSCLKYNFNFAAITP